MHAAENIEFACATELPRKQQQAIVSSLRSINLSTCNTISREFNHNPVSNSNAMELSLYVQMHLSFSLLTVGQI